MTSAASSPTYDPFLAATKRPRRHRQRPPVRTLYTVRCSRRADRSTLSWSTPNGPGVTATDDYFEPSTPTTTLSLPHRPFQPPRRQLRCEHKTNTTPRPPPTPSPTHFNGLLHHHRPRLHAHRGKRTLHRHDHRRHILRPTTTDYDSLTAGRHNASTASSATTTPPPARARNLQHLTSRRPIALHRTTGLQQCSYGIVRDLQDATVSRLERRNIPFQDLSPRFVGPFFVQHLHHPVPHRP
ncbi:unnamed protein product [Laminaria digitata]